MKRPDQFSELMVTRLKPYPKLMRVFAGNPMHWKMAMRDIPALDLAFWTGNGNRQYVPPLLFEDHLTVYFTIKQPDGTLENLPVEGNN